MHLFWSLNMAADEGFEPSHTESESAVLPLHKSAICARYCRRKSYYSKTFPFVKKKMKNFFLFCKQTKFPSFFFAKIGTYTRSVRTIAYLFSCRRILHRFRKITQMISGRSTLTSKVPISSTPSEK